ncbi:hypothetical protein C461_13396 [Halorubrum aidingense JCM 13560]|uniref:DUF7974 domain-containing protein n=1 Tax=Halorubrum aidingense JCM 13560 TaxID=1230454 RepID=M0P787_9EURY|nr:hypothetical protein [Halorubrum aidingense]EMA65698.1 hypothetical protein C461_13396 [Halorubrum aidingense JCM 13560]
MVKRRYGDDTDRTGFDETRNYLTDAVSRVVPQWLARRAVTIEVDTDRTTYDAGDPVEITVRIRNRLPLPVEVVTATRRRWGWRVDDVLEATDEQRYLRDEPTAVAFRAGETKTATVTWNGHFRRKGPDGLDRSVPADRGEHTISVFLPVTDPRPAHEDSMRIQIR